MKEINPNIFTEVKFILATKDRSKTINRYGSGLNKAYFGKALSIKDIITYPREDIALHELKKHLRFDPNLEIVPVTVTIREQIKNILYGK